MPAKKRCQFHRDTDSHCSSAALRIVGECPHCRASFCGSVSRLSSVFSFPMSYPAPHCSTGSLNTMSAVISRTAGSKHSSGTRASWRASGRLHPRLLRRDCSDLHPNPSSLRLSHSSHQPNPHTRPTHTITSLRRSTMQIAFHDWWQIYITSPHA